MSKRGRKTDLLRKTSLLNWNMRAVSVNGIAMAFGSRHIERYVTQVGVQPRLSSISTIFMSCCRSQASLRA